MHADQEFMSCGIFFSTDSSRTRYNGTKGVIQMISRDRVRK